MMGSQPEVTARIDRNELLRLLATMRTADPAPPVATAPAEVAPPAPRKHARPSSEVAALLPPPAPIRRPRITCSMPVLRTTPPTGTRAVVATPAPSVPPAQPQIVAAPRASLIAHLIERFAGFVLDGLC